MQIPLLQDIVILLGLSVGIIYLFQRLRLPIILGFLATGILFGPAGLGFIQASHDIEILAEIGIILLLFIIGLEFSLSDLARIKKVVFIGGLTQVMLTIILVTAVLSAAGLSLPHAVFFGFLISLSSTAIVLSILQGKGLMTSPQGKISLGILIFQDIIVVPMMLLTPMLAGQGGNIVTSLGILILKVVGVVVVLLLSARFVVPRLLEAIAGTRSRELFLISIVVICFAVAWGTSSIGLSLSLGAFMAGLVISESEYSHQATGLIIPFREIFSSFFFVSIGMLLDLSFVMAHLPLVLLLTAGIFLLKFILVTTASLVLRYPIRTGLLVGFTLFQVGEFSFILADVGLENNLIGHDPYQYFLSVSILTMAMTPFVMNGADRLASLLLRGRRLEESINRTMVTHGLEESQVEELHDHLIIIGYGLNGRNLASIARQARIPYVIVDVNSENVREGKKNGEPILYGDATNPYILEHIQVYKSRVAVIAISDAVATRKVVSSIRQLCNTVHILVRGRFLHEAGDYFKLGASEVISEEFESSVEIFVRVLHQYYIPETDVRTYVTGIRDEHYQMLRPRSSERQNELELPGWHDYNTLCMRIQTTSPEIIHKPLKDSMIKNKYNVTVLAVQRNEELITDVNAHTTLEPGDVVHAFGAQQDLENFKGVVSH